MFGLIFAIVADGLFIGSPTKYRKSSLMWIRAKCHTPFKFKEYTVLGGVDF